MAVALIWSFIIFPFLIKIPSDYSATYEFKGVNHVLNPQNLVMEETFVSVEKVQTTKGTEGNVILINQETILRSSSSGAELSITNETFGVNRSSRENEKSYGDEERNGQFTFPLNTKRKDYNIWVSAASQALEAQYMGKEVYNDILVYNFKINEQVISISPDAATGLAREIDLNYDIKVEPISGLTVYTSATSTIKLVYSQSTKTPIYVSSIRYTDATIDEMVQEADKISNFVLWSKTYGFWLAIGIGGALFLLGLIKETTPED